MTKVAVFGATGYGGVELVRLLLDHPEVELTYLAGHSTVGENLAEFYQHLSGAVDMEIQEIDVPAASEVADLMFFCLPHAVGAEYVAEALELGNKVIDFSADCRLKSATVYEQYYETHPRPDLLENAVYGLPELHRDGISRTQLTAVPGCYPTSAILALAPAVAAGLIGPALIVDSKSGVSGAGRKLSLTTHYTECNESVAAYSIAKHRHTPEMVQELSTLGTDMSVTFTPHLVPMNRGILSTCYAHLSEETTVADALEVYRDFYDGEPFVRVLDEGLVPATKHVSGSNFCDVGLAIDENAGLLIAVAAIDNLIKGLSGAAVQCMNLMIGCDETTGLTRYPYWP